MKSNTWQEPCQIYSYFPAAHSHHSLTSSELNCSVTGTKGCKQSRKQFTQSRYPATLDRESNPRPLDRKSNAHPLLHHATLLLAGHRYHIKCCNKTNMHSSKFTLLTISHSPFYLTRNVVRLNPDGRLSSPNITAGLRHKAKQATA